VGRRVTSNEIAQIQAKISRITARVIKIVTSAERSAIYLETVRIMPIIQVVTPSIPVRATIVVALVIYHVIARITVTKEVEVEVVVVEIVPVILIVIDVVKMGTWPGIVNPRMKSVTTAVKAVT